MRCILDTVLASSPNSMQLYAPYIRPLGGFMTERNLTVERRLTSRRQCGSDLVVGGCVVLARTRCTTLPLSTEFFSLIVIGK